MGTMIRAITAIMILASFTFAGQRNIDINKVADNFLRGLTHENQGVVESSIKMVILMKIEYPDANYARIIEELEDLVMQGENRNIRMKALIAADYLNNFRQYQWLNEYKHSEGDQIFDAYLSSIGFKTVASSE